MSLICFADLSFKMSLLTHHLSRWEKCEGDILASPKTWRRKQTSTIEQVEGDISVLARTVNIYIKKEVDKQYTTTYTYAI